MKETKHNNIDMIMVKALEDNVTIIGLTRGSTTSASHIEKLSIGEVFVAQLTERTAAFKIKGRAEVYSAVGKIEAGILEKAK